LIEGGKVRAYSINSVNRYSLLNEQASPQWKAELLTRYDRYITDEVLPLIRNETGDVGGRPITTGASLGAFLSANAYFRHPDLMRGVIAMSGSYDIRSYLHGYTDDNVYFNNPAQYLPNLNDDYYLPILRRADAIFILSGQGAYEAPERSSQLQRHPTHLRPLGTRRESRLALVEKDATALFGKIVWIKQGLGVRGWKSFY
jgi:esterase/lipase superfamily enzyme